MRYAVVGTGWITRSFIEGADIAGRLTLSAVYSRKEETGRELAESCGKAGVPVFTDLPALAAWDGIDGVYIASPNAFHYEQSRLFLENGKHVLCEKPITVTPAQLRELTALADASRLVYMEALMMAHLPARKALKDALPALGKITAAHFDFSQFSSKYHALSEGTVPNIFNPRMAAGCLMDLGIYCVYPAVDLFGRPEAVTASAGFLKTGADGYGSAILRYADKLVTLTYSKLAQDAAGSQILGDRGTLHIASVSKLTGMTLYRHADGDADGKVLTGDIQKPVLMSGEAADFARLAADYDAGRDELRVFQKRSLDVCEVMEEIRKQCGIRFADDAWGPPCRDARA